MPKIKYTQNPLECEIILDETDKKLIRAKAENESLLGFVVNFYIHADEKNFKEEWQNFTDNGIYDKEVEGWYQWLVSAADGIHVGDCTAFACTCDKCQLEDVLEIHSIPYHSKHVGSYILDAFKENKTIDDAIKYLTRNLEYTKRSTHNTEEYKNKLIDISESTIQYLKDYKVIYEGQSQEIKPISLK